MIDLLDQMFFTYYLRQLNNYLFLLNFFLLMHASLQHLNNSLSEFMSFLTHRKEFMKAYTWLQQYYDLKRTFV